MDDLEPRQEVEDAVEHRLVRHQHEGDHRDGREEGAGESTKLTVSFPGYGQKKLVEKYAGLEKA